MFIVFDLVVIKTIRNEV